MNTFRAIMIERDNRETIQCKKFTDIPFDYWSESKGTLTLEFPDIGYQANFAISSGRIAHTAAYKQWKPFKASSLEQLFCELPTRAAALTLERGMPVTTADRIARNFTERQEKLLEAFGSPRETGWGVILATLAGAGLLAVATAIKKPVSAQTIQMTEEVKEAITVIG